MKKNLTLNRPVFEQQAFDSSALTVLATLFHRFVEPADYDLTVRRDDRVIHRAAVRVAAEGAPSQLNLDLAKLGGEPACAREGAPVYTLAAGGVLGLYASAGVGRYAVTIVRLDQREKRIVLDSARAVPAGDLFAVTLVRPGLYQALTVGDQGRGKGELRVALPKEGDKLRVDQATLIELGDQGLLRPDAAKLFSGQSVVFQCKLPTRIQVQLVKPDDAITGGGGGGGTPPPVGPGRPPRGEPIRVRREVITRDHR